MKFKNVFKRKEIKGFHLALASIAASVLMPIAAYAQVLPSGGVAAANSQSGFNGMVAVINKGINTLLPTIISLTVLFLIWGIFQYVRSGDTGKQEEARNYIVWSLVAIAVMVSVWGLVNIITDTFSLNSKSVPQPPGIPAYTN